VFGNFFYSCGAHDQLFTTWAPVLMAFVTPASDQQFVLDLAVVRRGFRWPLGLVCARL